jgi:hypothetical protein
MRWSGSPTKGWYRVFRFLAACYRASLCLYPRELRYKYGREMIEVFERQVSADWMNCVYAIRELFTIAIPARMFSERMIAPVLSLVITSAVLATLVAIMQSPVCLKG